MFRNNIRSTHLTTEAADRFFENIYGDWFCDDNSFVSTLRALVAPRIEEVERIYLNNCGSSYSVAQLESLSVRDAVRVACDLEYSSPGEVRIHNFKNSSPDSNYAWMELMRTSFTSVYPEWHRLDKITDFYDPSRNGSRKERSNQHFYVLCFVNPDTKQVVIFTENLNLQRYHYLQCSILAFLPWYFDPEKGVTELEMELISSLREKSSAKYEECIAKIAEQYDFRSDRIRKMLSGFETKFERKECENMISAINAYIREINSLNQRIGEMLTMKSDCETKLLGLKAKIAESDGSDSEIMKFFLNNKNLVLEDISDSVMDFAVKGYLTFFDEKHARTMIENRRSYVYKPDDYDGDDFIPADDMERLMTAIFLDQTLRIRVCAAYRFDFRGTVSARSHRMFDNVEFRGYTPNPHINGYTCMGNYTKLINEALQREDYVFAISQCIASCQSFNFLDNPVGEYFMKLLYGISNPDSANICCIELPDGTVAEPKDAIRWLKSQNTGVDEE